MKEFLKKLKLNEANIGLGLGVAVLLLAGMLLISYFRSIDRVGNSDKTLSTATEQTTSGETTQGQAPAPVAGTEYTVQKGDSLWKISMKTYGSGYSWSKVYESNKDRIGSNPSILVEGTKLALPQSEVVAVEHTVVRGDSLWNISVKICGDGLVWTKLATDNNLANPRLIDPGQVLRVRCK